jgi:hypothetical protein
MYELEKTSATIQTHQYPAQKTASKAERIWAVNVKVSGIKGGFHDYKARV